MSTDRSILYCNPEIWGGLECTINRVGDTYRDQLCLVNHYKRPDDLKEFAALGIRKIRYPILWEKHQQEKGKDIDWSWTTKQLHAIRKLQIEPIAGLVHHGSGPAYTSLADKDFPSQLAEYARAVATQFPWINYYTPVNEPLTTARFSGLYGCWYPHHTDERSFVVMLLNQVKGIVLSMEAIRKINPDAKLVQTEDLAKTHSTPLLTYQAEFENKRRWLTYDLLCGKVDPTHFFWNYFISLGIEQEELDFFLQHSCAPDIMGFNYYVTSERYLDENSAQYPVATHGGNGIHEYADIAAVRIVQTAGTGNLLKEAWDRYQVPLAITECHLNCTREEQLRWFKETWDTACELCTQGVKVNAVTAWALLGAYDWNSLLTVSGNHYESGVFDVSDSIRRPTALAKLIHSLAATGDYTHPLLLQPGWWKRNGPVATNINNGNATPVLITGSSGTLGQALMKLCAQRSIPYISLSRNELDIANEHDIQKAIDLYKPWAIINAAGFVSVDDAELNSVKCFAVNATAPGLLAQACRQAGIRFVTFSTDLVFDGNKNTPYDEYDVTCPLNVYGHSKAKGESITLAGDPSALVIRTSSFFGPHDRFNFAFHILDALKNNKAVQVASDIIISPTYVPDLASAVLDLLIDEEYGIWHVCNEGGVSWADFALALAARSGSKRNKLEPRISGEMEWGARRPLYSVLHSKKGIQLPKLDDAVNRYFREQIF